MEITDLRTWFKNITGRQELTNDQVDAYLNTGQQLLDDMTDFQNSAGRYMEIITADTFIVSFTSRCQSINEVWLVDQGNDTKHHLERVDRVALKEAYDNDLTTETGTPAYWCPANLRTVPQDLSTVTYADYINYMDIHWGETDSIAGILLLPAADGEYLVDVVGRFYTPELTDVNVNSWWGVNHPMLLLWAAAYHLEVMYRNTEGANDWMRAIRDRVFLLDKNMAEQDSYNIVRLEG